jgi:hypothetical protein
MAQKTSRTGLLATLEYPYPLKVEVRAAEFEPYSSLPYLDVSKLSKGNHKIEVGLVKGGCCGLRAFAIVKAGMVVAVEVEPCPESKKPLSKNDRALVAAAYKKIGGRPPKWVPVSVEDFFGKPAVSKRLRISIGGGCISITWGDGTDSSPRHTIICCGTDERIVCSIITVIEVSF